MLILRLLDIIFIDLRKIKRKRKRNRIGCFDFLVSECSTDVLGFWSELCAYLRYMDVNFISYVAYQLLCNIFGPWENREQNKENKGENLLVSE